MNFSFYQSIYHILTACLDYRIDFILVVHETIIGVLLAFAQRSQALKPLVWFGECLCLIFRGTPMIVSDYIIGFCSMGITSNYSSGNLGVDLSRLTCILIIYEQRAYVSETVRVGINSVQLAVRGHILGIRPKNAMRYVILPQAIKNILPALGMNLLPLSRIVPSVGNWGYGVVNGATTVADNNVFTADSLICSLLLFDYDLCFDSGVESI